MHKSGSKKEPNSYISQIEVFLFKMFLNLPLENFFCRKHRVSILKGQGGTHIIWLTWYTRKCCTCAVYIVYFIYTKSKIFRKVPVHNMLTSSRSKGTARFAWWIKKKILPYIVHNIILLLLYCKNMTWSVLMRWPSLRFSGYVWVLSAVWLVTNTRHVKSKCCLLT